MIYKMRVSYLGKDYHGFAVQKGKPTIQSQLENALQTVSREQISIKTAVRTDKGVHALANVVTFEIPQQLDLYRFRWAVNAVLPADIKIKSVASAYKGFDPKKDAKLRIYSY